MRIDTEASYVAPREGCLNARFVQRSHLDVPLHPLRARWKDNMAVGPQSARTPEAAKARRSARRYWLFLIPVMAVVMPPLFNMREPTLGGFPFFYWYQILWIFLTAGLTWLINRREP